MRKGNVRPKYRQEFPADFAFDYKDPGTLYRFLTEGGKIVPSRISKLSAYQQRAVTQAVKKSRNVALLPVGDNAFDTFPRPEQISPVPFDLE